MRVHNLRTRAVRTLVAGAILASVTTLGLSSSSAAGILPTTTTVVTSGNPALAGSQVTFTATVKILGINLGPITPKGTVTFTYGTTSVTKPVSSCIILLTQCTASATMTALPESASPTTVTAKYNGDLLAKPSTGSLSQQTNDPVDCLAAEFCDAYLTAANESASMYVDTDGNGAGNYQLEMSFQSAPLSCTTAGTGDTGVFNVTDSQVTKMVEYTVYGAAATRIGSSSRVCWFSDQPFTTASGAPAAPVSGGFEGLLPLCFPGDDSSNPAPCVEDWDYYVSEGGTPIAYVYVDAPAGDPKITR